MQLPNVTQNYFKERDGVLKVANILNSFGFIFREKSYADIGIDGEIEHINENGEPLGRIVAVQIKSGDSYLIEKDDKFNFYVQEKHRNYWINYPLPVILFVYYPKHDKVYFTDITYQLRSQKKKKSFIVLSKLNYLTPEAPLKIFETLGEFGIPFYPIEKVFEIMLASKTDNPSFPLSYFDLFTQGLINICRSLYFNIDIAITIANYNKDSQLDLILESKDYTFLHNYVKFLVSQNLVFINYSDFLIDWKERELLPMFIAPLNIRGKELIKYIERIEVGYKTVLPDSKLIQERNIEMPFNMVDDFLRLEYVKRFSEIVKT